MTTEITDSLFSQLLPEVELVSRGSWETKYRGSGRVWRQGNHFCIHCAFPGTVNDWGNSLPDWPSGTLIPDDGFVDILGTMPDGRRILIERVVPNFFGTIGTFLQIHIECSIVWMNVKPNRPEMAASVELVYPFRLDHFNHLRNPPVSPTGECLAEWLITRLVVNHGVLKVCWDDNSTTIALHSREPFKVSQAIRAIELAIGFVLGHRVIFSVCRVCTAGDERYVGVRADSVKLDLSQMTGPASSWRVNVEDFLRMFKLTYILANDSNPDRADLLYHGRQIHLLQKGAIEDFAIACSRGIEAALKLHGEVTKAKSSLESEISTVLLALKSIEAPKTKNQIRNYVCSLRKMSARDKLLDLETQGVVPRGTVKAYGEIRHPVAHGHIFSNESVEVAYWQIQLLRDAYYHLFLRAAGYQGQVICYSVPDWPVVEV